MDNYKYVMAIDPGGTSGISFRIPALDNNIITTTGSSPEEVYDFFLDAKNSGLEQVVIENFKAELISHWGLHTVRIVGGIYALCYEHKIPLKIHQPQQRYPFKKEARAILKGRKVVIHELDALSHLLRWEYDNDII